MKYIRYINIHLDLSQVRYFYDYWECRVLEQNQPGKLVPVAPLSRDQISTSRAREMDAYGYYHKKSSDTIVGSVQAQPTEQAGCQGDISMTSPNILPVFLPGESIRGKVEIVTTKNIQPKKVAVALIGEEYISFRQYSSRQHTWLDKEARNIILEVKETLWKSSKKAKRSKVVFGVVTYIDDTELGVGPHEFPFQLTIPKDAQQSVAPLFCDIRLPPHRAQCLHKIKVNVEFDRIFRNECAVAFRGIWLDVPKPDMGLEITDLAVVFTKSISTGIISRGKINLQLKLPGSVYYRGDDAKVSVHVENASFDVIHKISCSFQMIGNIGIIRGIGEKIHHHTKIINLAPLRPRRELDKELTLKVDFSETALDTAVLPTSDYEGGLIVFQYALMLEIERKGHKKLKVGVPIIINAKNFH